MKILIVDDSRLARMELRQQLSDIQGINEIKEASNIIEAEQTINTFCPDLLLLDINMPGGDGFDLLDTLESPPMTIFVTAFQEHALKSFEYGAKDYLLKPVTKERLIAALDKLPNVNDTKEKALRMDQRVFIKDGDKCFFVALEQIFAFESIGNYSKVYLQDSSPCIYKNLSALESRLPASVFFRANRSWIVNTQYIENIEPSISHGLELTLCNELSIEVSRRQTVAFKQLWGI